MMRAALFCLAMAFGVVEAAAEPRISRGRVAEEPGVKVTPVAEGLSYPWGMAWLPDGALVVTEREGRLRVIGGDGAVSAPIPFPAMVTSGGDGGITRGQGGLMDVALSPNFAADRTLFFTYAEGDAEANRTVLARARFDGTSLADFTTLWRNPDAKARGQHFGSRLLFQPDGSLLVSIGDGGNPPVRFGEGFIRDQAQNAGTAFGKVLRFASVGGEAAVWTLGHRNVQGLARDPATGAVWATEHGAAGGDELNRLQAGANYGWPAVTYAREYADGALISPLTRRDGVTDPVVVWLDTHAPSGLAIYRGTKLAALDGAILSGGLITQDVRVVRPQEGARARETRIPIGERVRDVRVGPDGLVYVLTDGERGRLWRIEPAG